MRCVLQYLAGGVGAVSVWYLGGIFTRTENSQRLKQSLPSPAIAGALQLVVESNTTPAVGLGSFWVEQP